MNGLFEKRLRGVVVAAWWTVVIWAVLLTVSWGVYLLFAHCQLDCVLVLWGGPGLSWGDVQIMWICFLGVFKMIWLVFLMVTICLTLWLRQLRQAP